MKNYDEITNDLLERRDRYAADQRKRRKKVICAAVLACCFTAVIGLCIWNAARLNNVPTVPQNDEVIYAAGGENGIDDTFCGEYHVVDNNSSANTDNMSATSTAEVQSVPSKDDVASREPDITTTVPDVVGVVVIGGEKYVQFATGAEAEAYTLDTCLGSAEDFEGTYQTYLIDVAAKVYTVTDDPDVLIVKLLNGGTVALRKE